MPIKFGEPEAAKLRRFDFLVRQLELEARLNRRAGWHGNVVEGETDDLPPGMSLKERTETLERLTKLGYWRRLKEDEADDSGAICYYEVVNWWLTNDEDEAEFEDTEGF